MSNSYAGISWNQQLREGSIVTMRATPESPHHFEQVDVFRSILATATQFRGILDIHGQFLEINQLALDFSGFSRAEVIGQIFWEGPWWQTEKDKQDIRRMTENALLGRSSSAEFEIAGREQRLWVEVVLRPIRNSADAIIMLFVEGNNISERKRLEHDLRESERQNRQILEVMSEGLVHQRADGTITTCNPAAEKILGLSRDQMMGRTSLDPRWRSIHEDGSDFPGETHPAMVTLRTGKAQSNVVMGVHKPSGELTWILINSQPIFSSSQSLPDGVVCTFINITERKALEDKLRQVALYDALTGLPTRTLMMERLSQAIARHKRDAHTTFALLFIDLDNFKTVNDTLGHAAGDAVLVEVAQRLKNNLRETDTVARLGGDEFLVLLEGLDSEDTARQFAKRMSGELVLTVEAIEVRASIGLAHHDGTTAQALLARADKAMYEAKAEGKRQVTLW